MNLLRFAVVLLLLPLVFSSCKKEPETVPAGDVRVRISIQHHNFPIAGARIFMKKNAVQFPGTDTTVYDKRFVCDENGIAEISGLGNGTVDLYFYVKGDDPNFSPPLITPVWGYKGLTIVTKPGEDHSEDFYIYVSE